MTNIREGTIIYKEVSYGKKFQTGHNVLIRGPTRIGNNVLVGTGTIIEGDVTIGDNTRIQSGVYIPKNIDIGSDVFIGPRACFTNDKYPPGQMLKTVVSDYATIGGNATILPGLTLGTGCFIAAAAVVTKDVPAFKMAIGHPAKIVDLPEGVRGREVTI